MKKLLLSVMVITLVIAGLVGAGVIAYFSDPETLSGNTIDAGTIDIEVDGDNPWSGGVAEELKDLKPSEIGYITFKVKNVGENAVVVWKHIGVTKVETYLQSEPECDAEGGTWDNTTKTCSGQTAENNNIHTVMDYDLEVDGDVIFALEDGLSVLDIESMWMPIGPIILPDEEIVVKQSYHLRADTGNWAQGDKMTFTIDLYAEQHLGNGPKAKSKKLFLDNKTGKPDWDFVVDGEWAILEYSISGSVMTYDLRAQGLLEDGDDVYALIYYPEPQTTWPWGVTVLNTHTASGGKINVTAETASVSGITDANAKIWLCKKSDLNATPAYSAWPPTDTLFESNKISIP